MATQSLNLPPLRTCKKRQHRSMNAAREHLVSLREHENVTGERRPGYGLGVYRCDYCGYLHVGHSQHPRVPA